MKSLKLAAVVVSLIALSTAFSMAQQADRLASAAPQEPAQTMVPGGVPGADATDPAQMCGSRAAMLEQLSDTYKERPMAVGMVNKDAVVEILVSNTGTWTIIATGTDGKSCIMSAGEGWQSKTLMVGSDA